MVMVPVPARLGGMMPGPTFRLPYAPGDRLWVREAWRTLHTNDCLAPRHLAADPSKVTFEADPENRNPLWAFGRLRPSMFMPRWASRLTLIVTDVQVQRLHEMTNLDARAEGVVRNNVVDTRVPLPLWSVRGTDAGGPHPHDAFAALWDSLNADRGFGWDANPWVCAVTFTVRKSNIDQLETANG
ncbi:hypothetical protein ACFSYD_13550 [Paracoccus aerius]